ncbi:MAG: DUF2949 domain-containing protein [Microcoleaceae cyanobacterium]
MTPTNYTQLIRFLQEDLSIPPASIAFAQKNQKTAEREPEYPDPSPLIMTLWQYGLLTLEQLEKVFDWLETAY